MVERGMSAMRRSRARSNASCLDPPGKRSRLKEGEGELNRSASGCPFCLSLPWFGVQRYTSLVERERGRGEKREMKR